MSCNITTEFKNSLALGESPDIFLPIGYDAGGGGKTCIAIKEGDDYGKLYYWTDNPYWWKKDDYNYLFLIANSFTDFINGLYEMEADGKGNYIRTYPDGTVTITPD